MVLICEFWLDLEEFEFVIELIGIIVLEEIDLLMLEEYVCGLSILFFVFVFMIMKYLKWSFFGLK